MNETPQQNSSQRIIAVSIIYDEKERILVCKKPTDRGVFPGQWGLPGGGVEPGETLDQAIRREVREELGIELRSVLPLHFKEGREPKYLGGGDFVTVHMIYLLFKCVAASTEVTLNDEFVAYVWATPSELSTYDLNDETRRTFHELGMM